MARQTSTKAVEKAAAAATSRTVEHWMSRALPLATAPAGFIVLAPGIEVMHHYWGGQPTITPFYTLGVAAIGAGLSGYTWVAAGRRKHLRVLSTATAGSASLASVAGLVVGFPPIASVYVLGAVGLSVAWAIRHAMKWASGDGEGDGGHPLGKLGEAVDAERFKLRKLRGTGKGVVQGEVIAEPGATIDQFQALAPVIGAAARAPVGGVQVRTDPEDSGRATFRMTVADLLKTPIPFEPGPLGQSVTAPIPAGVYEHGDVVEITITGHQDGGVEHVIVMGTTGAGKSAFARSVVTKLMRRRRVAVIGVDPSGTATFGCIAHGLALPIFDYQTARRFIAAMSTVIKDRTDHLAGEGLDYWTEKSSLTFLVIWLEEAADLFATKSAYDEMLRKARKAGIWIISSLQRASHENLSTDARANHGAGICFGVRSQEEASMALPDEVLDAGAAPYWRATKKGYGYVTGLGTDPEHWATRMRGYDTRDKQLLAAAVAEGATVRTDVDEVTKKALGVIWEHRKTYTAPIGVDLPDVDTAAPQDLTVPAAVADPDPQVAIVVRHVMRALAAYPHLPADTVVQHALAEAVALHPAVDRAAVLEMLLTLRSSTPTGQPTRQPAPQQAPAGPRPPVPGHVIHDDQQPAPHHQPRPYDQDDLEDDDMALTPAEVAELADAQHDLTDTLTRAHREHLTDQGLADEHPDADLDSPIGSADDLDEMDLGNGEPEPQITPEQARALFETQLHQWITGGKFTFGPKDLNEVIVAMGRERTWFFKNIDRYIDAGIIAKADFGTYDILRSPHDDRALAPA